MEKPPEQQLDEEKAPSLRRRQLLRCCTCAAASLFFVAILALALAFTVFRVRGPVFVLNGSTAKLDLIPGTRLPRPGSNATIRADVSVRNRNYASFRYGSSASAVYYRGAAIGEARAPPGYMAARRTARMNVTVAIVMERVLAQPGFGEDVEAGRAAMSWRARIGGRMKFWFVKKHVTMKMNCTATVDVVKMVVAEYKFVGATGLRGRGRF
ncbi:uncharacterized protein LOC125217575 [Salvia hispanica]|uniref:uncharacterized protein LOC125217575 n=1 Tax=Salvia hispanica TaxID=49212 RepID=UPI002009B57D|nr:uncharacterized protein LOC125217575 [Salvia hispanica]